MNTADPTPPHLCWQAQPPRGWNSYDAYGSSVTQTQVLDNARALQRHLADVGFDLVTLDYCWSHPDPGPVANPDQGPDLEPRLAMDAHGRLLPAPQRFPSAAGGAGLKPLGDELHAMGQRFGLHMMRGIPRQAVADDCPILGGQGATARTIALPDADCNWLDQMVGVDTTHPAGQAYYDSVVALYASWGVDYLKADDLSHNVRIGYAQAEIEAIRRAIDQCGRPIVLSLSPGPAPRERAEHLRAHANLWRISADFWDRWDRLDDMFELCARWADQVDRADAGGWPDCDMIPVGPVSLCGPHGPSRRSQFTPTETQTMLNLWGLFRSPLILGGDLTQLDDREWAMLRGPYLRAHTAGRRPRCLGTHGGLELWCSTNGADGGPAQEHRAFLAVFNRGEQPMTLRLPDSVTSVASLEGPGLPEAVPAHGSALLECVLHEPPPAKQDDQPA